MLALTLDWFKVAAYVWTPSEYTLLFFPTYLYAGSSTGTLPETALTFFRSTLLAGYLSGFFTHSLGGSTTDSFEDVFRGYTIAGVGIGTGLNDAVFSFLVGALTFEALVLF